MKTIKRISIIDLHLASRLISRLEKVGLTARLAKQICVASDNSLAAKMMAAISTQRTLSEAQQAEEDIARIKLSRQFKKIAEFKIKIFSQPSLDEFRARRGGEFNSFHAQLTDRNFKPSANYLIGGEKTALVYQLIHNPTMRDCLAFIKAQKGEFPNAQGLVSAYEQWQGERPKNLFFLGLDDKENLWLDSFSRYAVPVMGIDSEGNSHFGLTCLKGDTSKTDCIIFFFP